MKLIKMEVPEALREVMSEIEAQQNEMDWKEGWEKYAEGA